MSNIKDIIHNAATKLSAVTDQTPVNWDKFDAVLKGLEDINACDGEEETILTDFILNAGLQNRGAVLAEAVRHFILYGYDVTAHDCLNGFFALQSLCWSSYDLYILEAAKALMNSGAPACCIDCDDNDKALLETIDWKIAGAWMVDRDAFWANILEAYFRIVEAYAAGKDYNSIEHYSACIGKTLTSVSAVSVADNPVFHKDGSVLFYFEPLILWFGDKPLVVNCYTDFIVSPVYADDKKEALTDVTSTFSSLIGATLQEIQYIGDTICFLQFSNGTRLIFASRKFGDENRVGTFEFRTDNMQADISQLQVKSICGKSGCGFSETTTVYQESAIALLCDDSAYLLYPRPGATERRSFSLCSCSEKLIAEYSRQYPFCQPTLITFMYEKDNISAVRFDFSEGYLYMVTSEDNEIEVQFSDKLYDPLEYTTLFPGDGKHFEFFEREDD